MAQIRVDPLRIPTATRTLRVAAHAPLAAWGSPMSFGLEARTSSTARGALVLGLLAWSSGCHDDREARPARDAAPIDADTADAAVPEAPTPDLRFKWVGAFDRYLVGQGVNFGAPPPAGSSEMGSEGKGADVFTTLEIWQADTVPPASSLSSWFYAAFSPAEVTVNVRSTAQSGPLDRFQSKVDALHSNDYVIVSLDFTSVVWGLTAVAPAEDSPRYRPSTFHDDRGDLDAWVASNAEAGRVVTALSTLDGRILAYAYAREGDAQTYETRVLQADLADVEARARDLSDEGYIVTAFGRDALSFVLVGTRPTGESEPKSLEILHLDFDLRLEERTHVPVAWVYDRDGKDGLMVLQR